MKLQIVSDLHLEFGMFAIDNNGADTLILSGDICPIVNLLDINSPVVFSDDQKSQEYHTFFFDCSKKFKHVVYVVGNHEYYHGDLQTSVNILRDRLKHLSNLHILEKQSVQLEDVLFVGGTLWTDMNRENYQTMAIIRGYMNDFRVIKNGNYKLMPADCVSVHRQTIDFLTSTLSELKSDQKVVFVGHHAPSKQSIKPKYAHDTDVNGAYSSDLEDFIVSSPNIKLWTHGHTHDSFDYMVGTTRIVCNPRGYYRYEENDNFNPNLVIEV